jgi:hypothetical protein
MPRRPALLLVALLALAPATPSHAAAPKPQVTDPKGDAVGMQPGTDLVSVLYSTTGTGTGRKYVPKKLLVTMTMAGDVLTEPGLTYEIQAETAPCGTVTFTAEQGSPYSAVTDVDGWADWGTCTVPDSNGAPTNVELLTVEASGKTIQWKFSLKLIPKELKVGTAFTDFEARVDPTNPVVPFPSNATNTTLGLIDKATAPGPWKLH